MNRELIGYADRISVSPGQTVSFKVSTDFPKYEVSIVRLIRGDPSGPGFREEEVGSHDERPGRRQTTHPGSYGIVGDSPALGGLRGLTIQMWIFPTTPQLGKVQGLLSKWSEERGFALVIGADGALEFWLGDGGKIEKVNVGKRLLGRQWYFVSACWDAAARSVAMRQALLARIAFDESTARVECSIQLEGPCECGLPTSHSGDEFGAGYETRRSRGFVQRKDRAAGDLRSRSGPCGNRRPRAERWTLGDSRP